MTENVLNRATSNALRLAALLMVIPIGACDNVEWGGADVAVVPPPPKAGPAETDLEAAERLPESPILYYVTRDSARATLVPVAEVVEDGLSPLRPGDDAEAFGSRFIAAFMREGAEFTLFRRGRRAGTLIVDSASVPSSGVCRRLPRAVGHMELSGNAGGATEFLAMTRTQAPEGRMIPGDSLEPERRMQVVGNIMAERALRARGAQLPNWSIARRQLFPFPVSETQDPGFTATFLVDDELRVGNDDVGYSLFIVYTPQAQTGYDTAYVAYNSYTATGKAAPRTVDFLDWNRDGTPELLLEVFGTGNRWFEAVGAVDGEWRRILEDRCDEGATTPESVPGDSVPADSAAGSATGAGTGEASRPAPVQSRTRPAATTPARAAPTRPTPSTPATTPPDTGGGQSAGGAAAARRSPGPQRAEAIPDLEPLVELLVPGAAPRPTRRDTQPDTSGIRPLS